jgi:hypothetical protein
MEDGNCNHIRVHDEQFVAGTAVGVRVQTNDWKTLVHLDISLLDTLKNQKHFELVVLIDIVKSFTVIKRFNFFVD